MGLGAWAGRRGSHFTRRLAKQPGAWCLLQRMHALLGVQVSGFVGCTWRGAQFVSLLVRVSFIHQQPTRPLATEPCRRHYPGRLSLTLGGCWIWAEGVQRMQLAGPRTQGRELDELPHA
jgi:hypothetical protein